MSYKMFVYKLGRLAGKIDVKSLGYQHILLYLTTSYSSTCKRFFVIREECFLKQNIFNQKVLDEVIKIIQSSINYSHRLGIIGAVS